MKTPVVVGIVIAVHCLALGSIVFIQGCRTPLSERKAPDAAVTKNEPAKPVVDETIIKPKAPGRKMPVKPPLQVKAEPVKKQQATTTYVVEKGDTLSGIAKKFHLKMSDIEAINDIKDIHMLKQGQKIMLPGKLNTGETMDNKVSTTSDGGLNKSSTPLLASNKESLVIPEKATTSAVSPGKKTVVSDVKNTVKNESQKTSQSSGISSATSSIEYVVLPDDTIQRIGMMWGVSEKNIREANGLNDGNVKPGQKIIIPLGK